MEEASRIKNINKMISFPQLRHMVQYGNATPSSGTFKKVIKMEYWNSLLNSFSLSTPLP